MPAKRNHAEDRLQMVVVKLLEFAGKPGLFWFHPPNEGRRSPRAGARNKAMGVIKGVPDLVLIWRGQAIGIELKAEKGRQTEDQRAVETAWEAAGGAYFIARGYGEAKQVLDAIGCLRSTEGNVRFSPRQEAAA